MVVVITGASAGVGRATRRPLPSWDHRLVWWAGPRRAGSRAARRESRGGRGLVVPAAGRGRRVRGGNPRADLRPDRRLGQQRDAFRLLAGQGDECRRIPPRDRGHLPGLRSWQPRRVRRMLPRDRGIIIQVGSALAYRGIPLQSAYCAAKHAIQGFCDSLRCELIHDGSNVRLTMVQMPAMNTPQFGWVKSRLPRKGQPVPPIFQPEGPPGPSSGRPFMTAARSAWAGRLSRPSWATSSPGMARPLPGAHVTKPNDRRARGPRPPEQSLGTRPWRPRRPWGLRRAPRRWSWQLWADLHR